MPCLYVLSLSHAQVTETVRLWLQICWKTIRGYTVYSANPSPSTSDRQVQPGQKRFAENREKEAKQTNKTKKLKFIQRQCVYQSTPQCDTVSKTTDMDAAVWSTPLATGLVKLQITEIPAFRRELSIVCWN